MMSYGLESDLKVSLNSVEYQKVYKYPTQWYINLLLPTHVLVLVQIKHVKLCTIKTDKQDTKKSIA